MIERDAGEFHIYCQVCGWEARMPADGTPTEVSDAAVDHHLETGHVPIEQREDTPEKHGIDSTKADHTGRTARSNR